MTSLDILIWSLLVLIAVSDAKSLRIPNKYLIVVLGLSTLDKLYHVEALDNILWSVISASAYFSIALVLFFCRIMAPGDVKLLGVVGYWLGWGSLLDSYYWISIASGVVGIFYLVAFYSEQGVSMKAMLTNYATLITLNKQSSVTAGTKLVMPFAPVIVIGLALASYFK